MPQITDDEQREVEFSCSSEEPYERWGYVEILSHQPGHIRLGRLQDGASLLFNHDWDELLGVIKTSEVDADSNKLRVTAKFSNDEEGLKALNRVKDGILTKVSIGYMVHSFTEEGKTEDGMPIIRVTDWEPYEVSLVTVPADPSVGIGKSAANEPTTIQNQITGRSITMTPEPVNTNPISNEDAVLAERARVNGIKKLETQYGVDLSDLVTNGTPLEKAYAVILEKIDNNAVSLKPPVDMNERELKEYSLRKVFLNRHDPMKYELGIEKEISQDLISKMDIADGIAKGVVVPHNIFSRKLDKEKRTLVAGTPSAGGYSVGTDHMGSEFIDLLRNEMVCLRAGVRVMSGLRGNIDIPKLTAGVSMGWGTEVQEVTEQNPTLGTVTMTPKSGAALVNASLQLLLQSDPSVELMLQMDMVQAIALGLDLAILHGTGTEQPSGIAITPNINSVTGAGIARGGILEFISDVKTANAANNLRWVTNPTIEALLKQREKVAGYPSFLMDSDGKMEGYNSEITNQVAAGYLFFGDFAQVLLGLWGGIDILKDPYTKAHLKTIRFLAYQFADVAVRIPGAFAVATGVS